MDYYVTAASQAECACASNYCCHVEHHSLSAGVNVRFKITATYWPIIAFIVTVGVETCTCPKSTVRSIALIIYVCHNEHVILFLQRCLGDVTSLF